MNRQSAAQLRLSPLHVQQGLFALLALLITLIGGQQYMRWEQSEQPAPVHLSIPHPPKPTSAPSAATRLTTPQCE